MNDIGQELLQAALDLLAPLKVAASDPAALTSLITRAGWDLSQTGLDLGQLTAAIGALGTDLAAIETALAGPPDLASVATLLPAVTDALHKLSNFPTGWTPPQGLPADLPQSLIGAVLAQLLVFYLGSTHSLLRSALEVLGVLDYPAAPQLSTSTGQVVRAASSQPRINLDLAGHLITDPGGTLMTRFGLAGEPRLAAAAVSASVFPFLADLARQVGLQAWYGDPGRTGATSDPAASQLLQRTLRIVFYDSSAAGSADVMLDVAVSLADNGTARVLSVVPTGTLDLHLGQQGWTADATLTGSVGPIDVQADSVSFADPAAAELTLGIGVDRPPGTDPLLRLGSATGPRFEISAGSAQVKADLTTAGPNVSITAKLTGVRIVTGDTDSFLSAVLPPGAAATCDLTMTWDPHGGLRLNGSPGITAAVPIGLGLGPVTIDCLRAAVYRAPSAGQTGTPPPAPVIATLGIDVALNLGPVSVTVTNVGIAGQLSTPATAGRANLGAIDLGLGLKPPDGVDLGVSAPAVSGGGFLSYDAAHGQYLGAVALSIGDVGVEAVGLLSTGVPGGPGYSLLVLACADFPPVQLGFGFSLTGIGGLVGVNRTADVTALQALARAGGLNAVMFPAGLASNAAKAAASLSALFPAADGHFIIGPAVRLAWGTGGMVDAEIGVFIELADSGGGLALLRVALLGWVHLLLPNAAAPVADITLDVLGVVDLAAKTLSIDAGLRNSKIAGFTLTGQAAVRASWGATPAFVLAIGGFNPHFAAPAYFPALSRITLSLGGNDPRLRLSAYLAMTSNTLQLGAAADLYASYGPAAVSASLSFDALIQFQPFGLEVDLSITATALFNNSPVLSISLNLHVSGPSPWHVTGNASFQILCFTVTVPISITAGQDAPPAPPQTVDLDSNLAAAVTDLRSWQTGPPAGRALVTVRPQGQASPAVHPLGTLTLRQHAVPLGQHIDRYGPNPLDLPCRYDLGSPQLAHAAAPSSPVTDFFAPAQFTTMTDAEKLASPSFEPMTAGLTIGPAGLVLPAKPGTGGSPATLAATVSSRQWDLLVLDSPDPVAGPTAAGGISGTSGGPGTGPPPTTPITLPASLLGAQLAGAAAAINGAAGQGAARYAGQPSGVALRPPGYAVISMDLATLSTQGSAALTQLPSVTAGRSTLAAAGATAAGQVVYWSELPGGTGGS